MRQQPYAHALKLWVMLRLGDGWMGLMESRVTPLLSGCYIGLRCGMQAGNGGEDIPLVTNGSRKTSLWPTTPEAHQYC